MQVYPLWGKGAIVEGKRLCYVTLSDGRTDLKVPEELFEEAFGLAMGTLSPWEYCIPTKIDCSEHWKDFSWVKTAYMKKYDVRNKDDESFIRSIGYEYYVTEEKE